MQVVKFILPQFGECSYRVTDENVVKTIESFGLLNVEVSGVEMVD